MTQKAIDNSETFNLRGYKPIVCTRLEEVTFNGIRVVTYETKLNSEERKLRNSETVSKVIRQLNMVL